LAIVSSDADAARRLRTIAPVIFPSHPSITTSAPSANLWPRWRVQFANRYAADVAASRIKHDDAQLAIVEKMTRLEERISEYLSRKSSALDWLFASREQSPIEGLYIYGEVGRGKTMLMDLFLTAVRSSENAVRTSTNLCSTCTSVFI
jgi:predicted ATPase